MPDKVIQVYADTSVYGGVFDEEFSKASARFFDEVRSGYFHLCVSSVLEEELALGPNQVYQLYEELAVGAIFPDDIEDAIRLQKSYLKSGIVTERWADDALHVAFATVTRCSLLVSWNFKHIVHYDKIALYNAINVVEGYSELGIYTPQEVIDYEEEL